MLNEHLQHAIELPEQATALNKELFTDQCAAGDVLVLVGFLDLDKDFFYLFKIPFRGFGCLS